MNTSKKQFAYENVDGAARYRVPLPEGKESEYRAEKYFLPHEESDFLQRKLNGIPYATYTDTKQENMEYLLENGYTDAEHNYWKYFFGFWKDLKGHTFLVPEKSPINDKDPLSSVGISIKMDTPAASLKAGKYVNRIFAPYPKDPFTRQSKCVWGKEISWNHMDGLALIQLEEDSYSADKLSEEDRQLWIRYVDLDTLGEAEKALVDGSIILSDKAVRHLNLIPKDSVDQNPKDGMAWRVTIATERGMGKGHAIYKKDLADDIDIIIYGPKTMVITDCFFFGNMGPLHAGVPHTDRQAVVNFHMHRKGMLVDLAKKFMREALEASGNEQDLRALFLYHTRDMDQQELDEEAWALRRALTFGVSFLAYPGLYRRVDRYLLKKVMACDARSRVPMDSRTYSVAKGAYVLPHLKAIDEMGEIHLENALKEDEIIFPDLKPGTRVICYRQPSENTNAWVCLKVANAPEYKAFKGRGICMLGQGAHKVLGRLGGGDMDDSFVIVHDPTWVEMFHTMRPYPETEKLKVEEEPETEERSELDKFTEELLEEIRDYNISHYSKKHVSWQIAMAKNARSGIGPVVNYGIIDMLMSDPDHKASMLADLKGKHIEKHDWLADREAYQAALYMTNLEVVIDGNVKDTSLLKQLGDVSGTIKAFHNECQVYPVSQYPYHIPQSKIAKGDYVLARSMYCRALEQIRNLAGILEDVFLEREWSLVHPANKDLRMTFPFEKELGMSVGRTWEQPDGTKRRRIQNYWARVPEGAPEVSLMDIWTIEWVNRPADESLDAAYARICELLRAETYGKDNNEMQRIAVEIYYQTYQGYGTNPKVDDNGKLRHVPDALLWCPVFANHFIDALREARLSGYYRAVSIRPELKRVLREISVMVEVRDHNVYIEDEKGEYKKWVGIVTGRAPNAKGIPMDNGIICYREGSQICQPEDPDMIAQRTLTRLVPQEEEVKPQVHEPKGLFAKLLKHALDYLK